MVVVREVGMHLDLVHGRHRVRLGGQSIEVPGLEVRDADGAGAAVALELLEHAPGRDEVAAVEGGQRPVDQEQVDVVEPERDQRGVEGPARVVGPMGRVAELAGDEHIVTREAGGADALADPALVAVHLRGVDVAVARLERLLHGPGGVPRCDLEDPEPELRDGPAVVEPDAGGAAHRSPSSEGPTIDPATPGVNSRATE